jgi:hypothetical protein
MSPASSDASMLAVAVPAPLRPALLAVDSCTRQHANLLVSGQIFSGLMVVRLTLSHPRVTKSDGYRGPYTAGEHRCQTPPIRRVRGCDLSTSLVQWEYTVLGRRVLC